MHFYKLYALGQDYIFCDDETQFDNLGAGDIKEICNRISGVGATGIFAIYQKYAKNMQIRAFDENGEIMRDSSTAAICAALGAKITTGRTAVEFQSEKGRFFTYISAVEDGKYLVSCDIGKCRLLLKNGNTERKTELGNRILTLTPVGTSAEYAVHFSECMYSLNREYLAEKTSSLSLFGGNASLILCEENGKNNFNSLPLYKNGCDITPFAGGFAAVGVAACLSGRSAFSQEMNINCNGQSAYVIIKEELSAAIHLTAGIAYEGNI